MESWNPLSNVAWTGPFNPCVHFPWLWKNGKYPDQALRGRVVLTHLENPLKDTRLGNKPEQMEKTKNQKPAVCSSGKISTLQTLVIKSWYGCYYFKEELLCGH